MTRIDEAAIDKAAVELIHELTEVCYDLVSSDSKGDARCILMTLGNIIGVIDMARAMKEALDK